MHAKDYLERLRLQGSILGIDRVRRFAECLGHPESKYPIIHVAGTNGKGSTCMMLERIYREAGYRTGLLTSPHLVNVNERIQVDRVPIDEQRMVKLIERMHPFAASIASADAEQQITFFEFITLMGFQYFAEQEVDIALIETGLGGRLDATNIVMPELSVITSIGYDHEHILGYTLSAIAGEKAGIIKAKTPVVLGCLPDEARAKIIQVAAEQGSVVYSIDEDTSSYPKTNLGGSYQRINAATACLAVEQLQTKLPVPNAVITAALHDLEWAGRWQHIALREGKTLILDAAHNEEGGGMLVKNLRALCNQSDKQPIIVMGALGEKRARSLLKMLCPFTKKLVLVRPDQSRACSLEELRVAVPKSYNGEILLSEIEQLFRKPDLCMLGESDDTIVVVGSIYLIGEVLSGLGGF